MSSEKYDNEYIPLAGRIEVFLVVLRRNPGTPAALPLAGVIPRGLTAWLVVGRRSIFPQILAAGSISEVPELLALQAPSTYVNSWAYFFRRGHYHRFADRAAQTAKLSFYKLYWC
ncbi:MAG: hypothetical protein ACP5O7_04400 [Phycisphaerae bacterium]